ncbi:DUF3139 domain-containing protein [Paenibacillus ehimensis]|uniref:DUF3139 domain-containing protein n=1 Tax=Paenibacillus ehimensis TaxID=79264 RepID=A0ABT8V5L7_9BACL|nr:DUF3139 domain-containing protein [Paenibacillus ehimensis]MDO3676724.1 DUF3139 domain-containing protein [Paenibacillus ehimensis]
MKPKALITAMCVSIATVILILFMYDYLGRRAADALNSQGEEAERLNIRQQFLQELSSKEQLSQASVQQISGHYDVKVKDYYVKVTYKDEPDVVYVYDKNAKEVFVLTHILAEGASKPDEPFKHKHRFSPVP